MYLVVTEGPDNTIYHYGNDQLQAYVEAVKTAYEMVAGEPSAIETASGRLEFYRAIKDSLGIPDAQERTTKLREALDVYSRHQFFGNTIDVIEVSTLFFCKHRVLPEEIVLDLDRQIAACLLPAQAEEDELAQQSELELELERQAENRGDQEIVNDLDMAIEDANPQSIQPTAGEHPD